MASLLPATMHHLTQHVITFTTDIPGLHLRPEFFQNCRLWRIASFARANALFEELPLHRVAGQRQRRTEVFARRVVSPAAQLKLAKRRRIKRVAGKAIAILD